MFPRGNGCGPSCKRYKQAYDVNWVWQMLWGGVPGESQMQTWGWGECRDGIQKVLLHWMRQHVMSCHFPLPGHPCSYPNSYVLSLRSLFCLKVRLTALSCEVASLLHDNRGHFPNNLCRLEKCWSAATWWPYWARLSSRVLRRDEVTWKQYQSENGNGLPPHWLVVIGIRWKEKVLRSPCLPSVGCSLPLRWIWEAASFEEVPHLNLVLRSLTPNCPCCINYHWTGEWNRTLQGRF